MRFLLDNCASSHSLRTGLIALGHEVKSVWDYAPRTLDKDLMAMALHDGRILVTLDKDFGELAVLHRQPHSCIVRLVEISVHDHCRAIQNLIKQYPLELERKNMLIVVDPSGVRFRPTD